MPFRRPALALTALLAAAPAGANEFTPLLEALVDSDIRAVVQDPVLIAAIRAQNAETAGLTETEILARDQDWRAQVGTAETPLINRVLSGPAAEHLRAAAEASGGLFTEIFAMDAVGLNVAASGVTSDYWQGDEAKWQETFPTGAAHIGEIELDESTQAYQAQVSVVVRDPETGSPIGAATFGVNVELLQ
ncbi:hypothetical protein LNKW23_11090 [Paralimibaculum aggregatum]|uniref:Uncharacterized protein n=1 Tax=Paralimibaculum aggregatum TaxID=3036245 RepID=A0ABQ6LHI6_9RHOB|nr:hypothetical protein [Limibaculum sp. NKW23]GMG81896.1 hypothetical protein LNKW23_11090 [Limibaculum sp. NKW23]